MLTGGALIAAAAIIPATGSSVSAADVDDTWVVTVSGTWTQVVDDDSTIFGSSFEYAAPVSFTRIFYVSRLVPQTHYGPIWSGCAGGEVTAEVHPSISHASGYVVARIGSVRLHEGHSCNSNDVDGLRETNAVMMADGASYTKTYTVGNTSEGGLDSATLFVRIDARRL
jgi:hypothetical protein